MSQAEETTPSTTASAAGTNLASTEGGGGQRLPENPSSAAPLLMGVELPIRILLGRTQLSLREITQLGSGAVVELDCSPDDPVQIMVNDRVIAQGEIVVVAGNYGVRITKIATKEQNSPLPAGDSGLLNLAEKLR